MADILKPWIAMYLIDIAETHGADLAGVPGSPKSQKGQIIRFLTDVSKPGTLWGMLSDGELSLPVKLAKEAVDDDREIYDGPLSNNCILVVKKHRVIFCRAPLGPGAGMSPDARLVIECSAFDRSPRVPPAILGEPKPIAGHADLHVWSEALKHDGGAGNILKQRKRQVSKSGTKDSVPAPPPVIEQKKPTLIARSRARIPTELFLSFVDKLVYNDRDSEVTPEQKDHQKTDPPKSGRATPCREDTASTSKRSLESSPEVFIEGWSPTPARNRSLSPAPLSLVHTRLRPSQLLLSDCENPEDEKPEESQMAEVDNGDAPSSSLPIPVPTQGQEEPTLDEDKMEIDLERPVSYEQPYPPESRKVPKPPSPKSFPKDGAGIVLVPNSDVSMAGSSQPSQGVASQDMMPLRRALSLRDLNVAPGEKPRGSKRTNAQLSQEDNYYDGDEETAEKPAVRAGKKNRLGRTDSCRSVNKEEGPAKHRPGTGSGKHDADAWRTPSFLKRKREQRDLFGEYPWPIVSARQILDIIAESDARRRVASCVFAVNLARAHRAPRRAALFSRPPPPTVSPTPSPPPVRASTASSSSSIGKLSPQISPPSSLAAQKAPSATAGSSSRDLVFLFMSVSFGCLSLMSLRNPFGELLGLVLGKSDLQSFCCLVVFSIVSLVLAYLTNPTENSFRTYLTEQSFRHHLSRLDDNLDSEQAIHDGSSSRSFHSASFSRSVKASTADRNGPFHFANRASISLRTPKHVFHSFAIFTIAAMVPVHKGSRSSDEQDGWSISDSWYIGAFGKWWRGGVWETWYQDVITRSKDEESWSSGILSMKNLDMLSDFHAPYMPKTLPFHALRQSPPKLRNRDHLMHKSTRNNSPPPLAKSASLPLHTKRLPMLPVERCDYLSPAASCAPTSSIAPAGASVLPTRSTVFDQSPLIAEVLRQISASTAAVQDIRAQYSDYQKTASQSHETLNLELESCRERKRQEDASRSEMKTKTKQLDDQKRTAEGLKREAEKKLKAAQTTRDNTLGRIEFLDKEISTLRTRTQHDHDFLARKSADKSEVELELSQALEQKKKEIKTTEELLLSLNRRSRELEEKLSSERERLESLKQKTELRKQEYSPTNHIAASDDLTIQYPYAVHDQPPVYGMDSPSSPVHPDGIHGSMHQFGMSLPHAKASSQYDAGGYPYSELDLSSAARRTQAYTNIGTASDHHVDLSRSIPLDNDPTLNPSWSNNSLYSLPSADSTSTTASLYNNLTDTQRDPDLRPSRVYDNFHDYPLDGGLNGHYPWSSQQDVNLMDEMGYLREEHKTLKSATTATGRQKKGLNPDAKVFSLPRKLPPPGNLHIPSNPVTYDALNPNGLVSSMLPSTTSTNSSLLRAFAPSRAEREALQRALGGSTNSSFERLPSLSEVGSIPSSPSHVHAEAFNLTLSHQTAKESAAAAAVAAPKTFNLPSWLTVLPNIKKSRFKPWDDDEPVSTPTASTVEDAVVAKS